MYSNGKFLQKIIPKMLFLRSHIFAKLLRVTNKLFVIVVLHNCCIIGVTYKRHYVNLNGDLLIHHFVVPLLRWRRLWRYPHPPLRGPRAVCREATFS